MVDRLNDTDKTDVESRAVRLEMSTPDKEE
jgi:hypothetical protein